MIDEEDMFGDEAMAAMSAGSLSRRWPATGAEMAAAMGYGTWSSGWQLDEASGTLADSFGSITLTAGGGIGTPSYRNAGAITRGRDFAVGFDALEDERFAAASTATFDLDAVTSLAFYACVRATASTNRYFMGKVTTNYWGVQHTATAGHIALEVNSGGTIVATTAAAVHSDSVYHDILGVIDRTGQRIQVFTDLATSTEADISAVGTLTGASPFLIGAVQFSNVFPCQFAFAAVATGGINTLRANGAAAITNIRRFTGRG